MPILIDENKMVEQNVFLYEERLKSPIRRFTDKSFTPVDYWHIKANETTVDGGYGDIAEILGKDSPIKYQKISNLPLYGLEQLLPQLSDGDFGLDTSIEGDAILMANTVKPLQNDFFMIRYLKDDYLFQVTGVDYDILSSDGCYKISYILAYIDNEKVSQLESQTKREFTCLMENIGTDERCIIENSDKERLDAIDKMYHNIVETMITLYYNERYNCMLADLPAGEKLYDPFQADFINKHGLLKTKTQVDSIVLSDQFEDPRRKLKYEKTLYRCLELQRMDHVSTFQYLLFRGSINRQTSFYRWLDHNVYVVDIQKNMDPLSHKEIFTDEFVDEIRLNPPVSNESAYRKLLKAFIRNEELSLSDIPLGLEDEIMTLDDANLEVYFITPAILYIIKTVVNNHLQSKKNASELEFADS